MFFKGSRYANVGENELTDRGGLVVHYKKVRFIANTLGLMTRVVTQGERLDHIAHDYFKDSERFWRICDANLAMWPNDLVAQPGRMILIPSSEGG